jgi:hypothetical protein
MRRRRMAFRDVALGPGGFPGRVWVETMVVMAPRIRHQLTRYLSERAYPNMAHCEAGSASEGGTPDGLAFLAWSDVIIG